MTDTTDTRTTDRSEGAHEYVLLLHGDETVWESATEEDRRQAYADHGEFARLCEERGHRITGGAELAAAATSLIVRQEPGGAPQVSEGPFAETVEQLGGYYVITTTDVADLARLTGMLVTGGGTVELRPVVAEPEQDGAGA
jgi:hypothetical protein